MLAAPSQPALLWQTAGHFGSRGPHSDARCYALALKFLRARAQVIFHRTARLGGRGDQRTPLGNSILLEHQADAGNTLRAWQPFAAQLARRSVHPPQAIDREDAE
jgi:hypothetical protein